MQSAFKWTTHPKKYPSVVAARCTSHSEILPLTTQRLSPLSPGWACCKATVLPKQCLISWYLGSAFKYTIKQKEDCFNDHLQLAAALMLPKRETQQCNPTCYFWSVLYKCFLLGFHCHFTQLHNWTRSHWLLHFSVSTLRTKQITYQSSCGFYPDGSIYICTGPSWTIT